MEFAWKNADIVLFISTVDLGMFTIQKQSSADSDVIHH